jgi:endonuclease-8
MPEGDTIHKMAATLRPLLLGEPLARVYLRERGELREALGKEVRLVEARGKHLLIGIDGGLSLRLHMGMHGRMRQYRASDAPAGGALPLLIATGRVAFAFPRASQVQLLRGRPEQSSALARLGPDLLASGSDLEATLDAVLERARGSRHYARALGELLLDQSVAAGIGNVYKSEVLFLCRQDPFAPVGSLDDATLREVYRKAAELMRQNLRPGRRSTVRLAELDTRPVTPPSFWVYRRSGEPCLKCGTPIELRRQGDAARSTYHCPSCQRRERGRGATPRAPERDHD